MLLQSWEGPGATEISIRKWVYLNSSTAPTSSLPSPSNLSPVQVSGVPGCRGFSSLPECVSGF